MTYEDNFSRQAPTYARHRPEYPPELFANLAGRAPGRGRAWDCGTGNGQAARGLAGEFAQVVGTDASAAQIAQATPHARIRYLVARAEAVPLAPASVDLVTVAQALHWFDLEPFYAEVRRVVRPGGVLAAWCYYRTEVSPAVNRILDHYYDDVVGPYWSPRVRLVDARYQTIPFPFPELPALALALTTAWDLPALHGYLRSWSATQRYAAARGTDPLAVVAADLAAAWGPPATVRPVRWPLYFRLGRVT